MKNSKGVSMISLIITIIVTAILASTAISTGTRYLKDSKKKEQEIFIEVLSNAVYKRQQDTNLNAVAYPYVGYYINDEKVFEKVFSPKIKVDYDKNSVWYVVDKVAAAKLGVKEIGDYIDSVGTIAQKGLKVALVNYQNSDVYLVNLNSDEITVLGIAEDNLITEHEHRYIYTEPTCTEAVKCEDCGFVVKEALGHLYEPFNEYDEQAHYTKKCTRDGCEMVSGFEAHEIEIKPDSNEWQHQKFCTKCDYSGENVKCAVRYRLQEGSADIKHEKYCTECSNSTTENHTIEYKTISNTHHEKYCCVKGCEYSTQEAHQDTDSDKVCDDCEYEIRDNEPPKLSLVRLTNPSRENNYAKYGDTLVMEIEADKEIQNLKITCAGYDVPDSAMSTDDEKKWIVNIYLDRRNEIEDGPLSFSINCESTYGIPLATPVISTTYGGYIVFDSETNT